MSDKNKPFFSKSASGRMKKIPTSLMDIKDNFVVDKSILGKTVDRSLDVSLRKLSLIEELGLEDELIKLLTKGMSVGKTYVHFSKKGLLHGINLTRYGNGVDLYLKRIGKASLVDVNKHTQLDKKYLKTKTKCAEQLAELVFITRELIDKYESEGDNTNTVNAVRVLNLTLMNFAKMSGFLDDAKTEVNITMVGKVSEDNKHLREKVISASFVEEESEN